MKLLFLTVGKVRDQRIASLIDDYLNRVRRFAQVDWQVVKASVSTQSRDRALQIEGERLLARLKPDDVVVLLDEKGARWDSVQLARWLGEQRAVAPRVVFVVGGPWGTWDRLQRRADVALALSPLTLQHDLALLVLAEQIYRAFTILSGHPYHK